MANGQKKPIVFVPHASDRFAERGIPKELIGKMLQKGVHLPDREPGKMLCIYKAGEKFYTVVWCEEQGTAWIITGYESNGWEKEQFRRAKRHEKNAKD